MKHFRTETSSILAGLLFLLASCSRSAVDPASDLSSPLPAVPFETLAQQKIIDGGGTGGGATGNAFDSNGGMIREFRGSDEIDYTYDTHLQVTEQKILLSGGSMGQVAQQNVYDGDGNQIAFYSVGVTYTYVTAQVRTVSRNNGAPVALVSYEDSETDENGRLQQMVKDHLGSVVAIVDSQDGFRMVKDQLPFGATWYERELASYSNPTDKGFNGNRDEGFKNYGVERLNYNARHYAPEIARFLQADSVTPEGGATVINWNRYVYVNNNPINGIDPTGHEGEFVTMYHGSNTYFTDLAPCANGFSYLTPDLSRAQGYAVMKTLMTKSGAPVIHSAQVPAQDLVPNAPVENEFKVKGPVPVSNSKAMTIKEVKDVLSPTPQSAEDIKEIAAIMKVGRLRQLGSGLPKLGAAIAESPVGAALRGVTKVAGSRAMGIAGNGFSVGRLMQEDPQSILEQQAGLKWYQRDPLLLIMAPILIRSDQESVKRGELPVFSRRSDMI